MLFSCLKNPLTNASILELIPLDFLFGSNDRFIRCLTDISPLFVTPWKVKMKSLRIWQSRIIYWNSIFCPKSSALCSFLVFQDQKSTLWYFRCFHSEEWWHEKFILTQFSTTSLSLPRFRPSIETEFRERREGEEERNLSKRAQKSFLLWFRLDEKSEKFSPRWPGDWYSKNDWGKIYFWNFHDFRLPLISFPAPSLSLRSLYFFFWSLITA